MFIESVGHLDTFADTIESARSIINFVRGHTRSLPIYHQVSVTYTVCHTLHCGHSSSRSFWCVKAHCQRRRVAVMVERVGIGKVQGSCSKGRGDYRGPQVLGSSSSVSRSFACFAWLIWPHQKYLQNEQESCQSATELGLGFLASERKVGGSQAAACWITLHSPLHTAAYALDHEFAFNDTDLPSDTAKRANEIRIGLVHWLRKVF